jgi:hypothetical protein
MSFRRWGNRPSQHRGSQASQAMRYQAQQADHGLWAVMDMSTGLPASSNGRDLVELARRDAEELAEELESCERNGEASPLL